MAEDSYEFTRISWVFKRSLEPLIPAPISWISGHAAKPNVEANLQERLEKSFGLLGFTDLSTDNSLGGMLQDRGDSA